MSPTDSNEPEQGADQEQPTRRVDGESGTRQIQPATRVIDRAPPEAGTARGLGPAPPAPPAPAKAAAPAPAEPATDELPFGRGTMIDRYMVVDVLGRGGMGVVLRAFDPDLDRSVAIKVLLPSASGGDRAAARARLVREAQAMARLSHPNVVTVFDVGMVEGHVFVAMEHAASTLKDWITVEGRSWRDVLGAYQEAGRGLAAAHRAGLVHRDFKPANVLVSRDGEMWVTDFGLVAAVPGVASAPAAKTPSARSSLWPPTAGLAGGAEQSNSDLGSGGSPLDLQLTRSGVVMGTPAYMAPEQHAGSSVDARADQFSFCVALYRGLYGQRPFAARGIAQLRAKVLQGKVEPPPADTVVPEWIWEALRRGLAVEPTERFGSMDELLHQLGRDPEREQAQHLTVEALIEHGSVKGDQGDLEASEAALREARSRAEQAGDLHRVAEASLRLAVLTGVQAEQHRAGLDMMPEVSELIARAGEDPWQRARLHSCQGVLLRALDDNAGACGHFEQALALTEQTGRGDDYVMAAYQNNLGDALYWLDREPEALASHQRALAIAEAIKGPNSVEAGNAHRGIALCKLSLEQLEDSLHHCELALDIIGDDPSTHRLTMIQLHEVHARAMHNLGRHEEAVALWRHFGSLLGESESEQAERATVDLHAGTLLLVLGRHDEAEPHLERALELYRAQDLPDQEEIATTLVHLGRLYKEQSRFDQAVAIYREALAIRRGPGVAQPLLTAGLLSDMADLHYEHGAYDEAVGWAEQSLEELEAAGMPDHPWVAIALTNMGNGLVALKRFAAAVPYLERALGMREGTDCDPGLQGGSRIGLAMALWHSELDRPRAVQLARQALQEFIAAGPAGEANVLQIRSWLAQCEPALGPVDGDGPSRG